MPHDCHWKECPLCLVAGPAAAVRGADDRRYHLCGHCSLIFADPAHFLPADEEKARYAQHENGIGNPGYVQFLMRAVEPMLAYLAPGMRGLDYGCGPGPTLSLLVKRQGFECDDYDPFFANQPPRPPYDFVFATECFEHFHRPAREIERIHALLKPGGLLAIMTERWTAPQAFASWYYTRDETHVSFYHADSLDYICTRFGFAPVWMDESRVAIFRRHPAPADSGPADSMRTCP